MPIRLITAKVNDDKDHWWAFIGDSKLTPWGLVILLMYQCICDPRFLKNIKSAAHSSIAVNAVIKGYMHTSYWWMLTGHHKVIRIKIKPKSFAALYHFTGPAIRLFPVMTSLDIKSALYSSTDCLLKCSIYCQYLWPLKTMNINKNMDMQFTLMHCGLVMLHGDTDLAQHWLR